MTADGVRTHGMYELRANSAALRGDADHALESLRTAVSLGWRATWQAGLEPYFGELRREPRIAALLAEVEARNAAEARLVLADETSR